MMRLLARPPGHLRPSCGVLACSPGALVAHATAAAAAAPVHGYTGRWLPLHRQRLLARHWNSCRQHVVVHAGLPFSLQKPAKLLKFKWARQYPAYTAGELQVEVDMLQEGSPAAVGPDELAGLLEQLEEDCQAVVPLVLHAKQQAQPKYRLPAVANLSLLLCDDAHIRQLNKQYRDQDAATDVLSFEIPDEAPGLYLPIKLLGDLVISLDTASRQAAERRHSLLTELRILLVHGLLHLAGFDHERGLQQLLDMAAQERAILAEMGWQGSGLISAAGAADESSSQGEEDKFGSGSSFDGSSSLATPFSASSSSSTSSALTAGTISSSSSSSHQSSIRPARRRTPLVVLDMDGTLLDSDSKIRPESVQVIKAAVSSGVRVVLATGKARPAAIAACRAVGLEGDGLLVSSRSPGVFLQGLAVHGHQGQQLSDAALPSHVVQQAFSWADAAGVSCVAFLGDECATLRLTGDLRELHTRYYEPLAQELPSLEALLAGPAVRKLLFMAEPELVEGLLKPHWGQALRGQAAEVLQAVPNMLEVVPQGVNKWAGLQVLLDHLHFAANQVVAVGDGSNDLEMVSSVGMGVAMGNAVPAVKAAAAAVVSSNDEGGIVEAFERFVL